MAGDKGVHGIVTELHGLFFLESSEIHRRRMPTNLAVGFVGDGGLVNDGVVGVALDTLFFAPVLWTRPAFVDIFQLPVRGCYDASLNYPGFGGGSLQTHKTGNRAVTRFTGTTTTPPLRAATAVPL